MLAVISVALLILACSFRSQYSSSNSSDSTSAGDDDHQKLTNMVVNSEPKIVVIMAGESNPTYLAKPVTNSSTGNAALQAVPK